MNMSESEISCHERSEIEIMRPKKFVTKFFTDLDKMQSNYLKKKWKKRKPKKDFVLEDKKSTKCLNSKKNITEKINGRSVKFLDEQEKQKKNQKQNVKAKTIKERKVSIDCKLQNPIQTKSFAINHEQIEHSLAKLQILKVQYKSFNQLKKGDEKLSIGSQFSIESGITEVVFEDGSMFRGRYENGVMIKGEMQFKGLFVYKGEFFLSKFHGWGQLIFPNGQIIEGEWNQGIIYDKAKITYPKGQIYYGEIKNFKRNGDGNLFFKDGSKYTGEFSNGEITGYGTFISTTFQETVGYWHYGDYLGQNETMLESKKIKQKNERSKWKEEQKGNVARLSESLSEIISHPKIISIKKII